MFEVTVKLKTAYELSYEDYSYQDFRDGGIEQKQEYFADYQALYDRYSELKKFPKKYAKFSACKKEAIDLGSGII